MKENSLAVFEDYKIRRVYDEESETWYFSVVDIIQVLIQQPDYQTARKYWNKLKERLKKEGSQSVTNCHRLKMEACWRSITALQMRNWTSSSTTTLNITRGVRVGKIRKSAYIDIQ